MTCTVQSLAIVSPAAPQPFKTDSVTSNGIVDLTAPAQADRLGNTGAAGAVTVRVDKAKLEVVK